MILPVAIVKTYVGIGSNLGDPVSQVLFAKQALQHLLETRITGFSSLYLSSPMGPQDQPDYVNAVAELETGLIPHQLLKQLQRVEQQQGRVREQRWGSRTLDLDILLYGQQQVNTADLVIPHYGIAERAFVLYPLHEIAPDLNIPGHGSLKKLLSECPSIEIKKLAENPLSISERH